MFGCNGSPNSSTGHHYSGENQKRKKNLRCFCNTFRIYLMKWVFCTETLFPNRRCCKHSTLSNTSTHNTAQYTHPLTPPPFSPVPVCFCVSPHVGSYQVLILLMLHLSPDVRRLWINKTFQLTRV